MSIQHHHYSKQGFWDDYYKSHSNEDFEWFLNPKEIKDMFRILEKGSPSDNLVLDVGCGYSNVLEHFYQKGYKKMVGIDYSLSVVERQREKYAKVAEFFEFYQMDALDTDFQDKQFDLIVDKGLLDCFLVGLKEWAKLSALRTVLSPGNESNPEKRRHFADRD